MVILESGIQMAVLSLDKRKRRFTVRLLVTRALDNSSERNRTERTMEEIFQSIAEWCSEDYRVEEIRYNIKSELIGIGEPIKNGMDLTDEEIYDVVIYTDRSTQMPEAGF